MVDDKPWLHEPDSKSFEALSYQCEIRRNGVTGALCGYVTVPGDHPWARLDLDARVTPPRDELMVTDRTGPFELLLEASAPDDGYLRLGLAVEVHGGVTYAQCETDGTWTFGFDCGHGWDYMPLLMADWPPHIVESHAYRDMDYVTADCVRMAAQLRIVERRGSI